MRASEIDLADPATQDAIRFDRWTIKRKRGCWEWIGPKNGAGYGAFKPHDGPKQAAHRYIMQRIAGPIPKGKYVCHKCDNPSCVRPRHLYIGTAATNAADRQDRSSFSRTTETAKNRGSNPTNRTKTVPS